MSSGSTFWALIEAPEPLPAIVHAAEELRPQTVLLPAGWQVVVIMLDEFVPRRESVLEVLEASAGLGELPDLHGGNPPDDSSR